MHKPKVSEEILDYAQCYLYSGRTLAHQFSIKPPYKTVKNLGGGYILCAHFLMAHGIELYLKFLIKLFGDIPPSDTHNLTSLTKKIDVLLQKDGYRRNTFNIIEMKMITYLDRYEIFRYPTDKNWKTIPDMFNEAETWTTRKSRSLDKQFKGISEKLNTLGYMIQKKKANNTLIT